MKKKITRSRHEVTSLSRKLSLIAFLLFPIASFFLGRIYQKGLDVDQLVQEQISARVRQTSQLETSEMPSGICIPSTEMLNGGDQSEAPNQLEAL